jgi:hypothetical protein
VLGFLGFPPFAVECLVVLRFLGALGEQLTPEDRVRSRIAAAVLGPMAVVAMFAAVDRVTVDSFYRTTAEMTALPAGDRGRLAAAGLTSPELLARRLRDYGGRAEWSMRSGLDPVTLRAHHETARLVLHRGIGDARAARLHALGIRRVQDLDRWNPKDLARHLRTGDPRDRFLERRVRGW